MDKRKVESFKQQYDVIVRADSGTQIEYWYVRELMPLLGYERWENFKQAIQRAIESCNTAGITSQNHFREVTKMVVLGSGSRRGIQDYMLTRYACYLIAQNA